MSLAKALFAGAAVCALCTAPALAGPAPNIHLAGFYSSLTLKAGSAGHHKTGIVNPDISTYTSTVTFTGTIAESSYFKVPTLLWAETWADSTTCAVPANEKGSFTKKTAAAKISVASVTGALSTGACPTTMYTFYGPMYDLTSKTATSDSFAGSVVAKRYEKYNLTLNVTTDLTITH